MKVWEFQIQVWVSQKFNGLAGYELGVYETAEDLIEAVKTHIKNKERGYLSYCDRTGTSFDTLNDALIAFGYTKEQANEVSREILKTEVQ